MKYVKQKLEEGMEVYCDIHPYSKKHVITSLKHAEETGFAVIDNEFFWDVNSCFPCETTKLPYKDPKIHEIFG